MKNRIKSLRTYFARELTREKRQDKNGESGTNGTKYESKWSYFKMLEFLRDAVKPRTLTTANLLGMVRYILYKKKIEKI